MPIPTPSSGESHDDYIGRCMHVVMNDGTTSDNKQGYAICQSYWDKAHGTGGAHSHQSASSFTDATLVQLSASSQGTYRYDTYQGRTHVVVPFIGLRDDIVMRPHGSRGASLVPGAVISRVASSWNGRAVVMDHPFASNGEPLSANSTKSIHEKFAYGTVFNCRHEDGAFKGELWLDPERAKLVGADAQDVIARALAGEKIEVSVGARAYEEPDVGTSPNGTPYAFRWVHAEADHLATLPRGVPGACSWEMGCGVRAAGDADVSATPGGTDTTNPPKEGLVVMSMSQARTPSFSGTESTPWSKPSFADYVSHLHTGGDKPSSVSDASQSLKDEIAAHSLLGDPKASSFGELSFFPVVNPATGKLNEGALRAVMSGRGSQASISADALKSARDTARRLLNKHFGAKLAAASDALYPREGLTPSAWQRVLASFGIPIAARKPRGADTSGATMSDIHNSLHSKLNATEPAYSHIHDIYPDTNTVVYSTMPEGDVNHYQRTYSMTGNDPSTLSLNNDRQPVSMSMQWMPLDDVEPDPNDPNEGSEGEGEGNNKPKMKAASQVPTSHATASTTTAPIVGAAVTGDAVRQEEDCMCQKELAGRLIASARAPFDEKDRAYLEAQPVEKLTSLLALSGDDKPKVDPPTPPAAPTQVAASDTSTPVFTEEQILKAFPRLAALVSAAENNDKLTKTRLVNLIAARTNAWSNDALVAKSTDELGSIAKALGLDGLAVDFSLQAGGAVRTGDDNAPRPVPDSYQLDKEPALKGLMAATAEKTN